jgi:hypothetical protein
LLNRNQRKNRMNKKEMSDKVWKEIFNDIKEQYAFKC